MDPRIQVRAFPGTSRFEPLKQLGAGGMGVVYAAFDRERNTRVALKTLPSFTPDSLRRFKNEFRAIQDIRHPNLVNLDELMEVDGTWFFTMELVDGVDFLAYVCADVDTPSAPALRMALGTGPSGPTLETQQMVRSGLARGTSDGERPERFVGPGPNFHEGRLREALRQLVAGIAALHAAGKVHRDIKPSNVLVTSRGRVVILDFGLISDVGILEKGAGTVKYMAPEQAAGEAVGPEADWYGVGVTLYAALTGNVPFVGQLNEILTLKQQQDPPPPSEVAPDVPRDLDALCMALLRRNPAARPSARDILAALGVKHGAPALSSGTTQVPMFVGRSAELAALENAFVSIKRGERVAMLVQGESGVGKSALVRRFLDELSGRGDALVLAARCYERESVPYKAVDQVMEGLAEHLASLPEHEAQPLLPPRMALLAEIFPAFQQIAGVEEAVRHARGRKGDPSLDRAHVFNALRELVLRVSAGRSIVVAIDDLQWADADSLALLADLLRAPGAPPLLFVATVRAAGETMVPGVAGLREQLAGDQRDLRVSRLPGEAARELVERLVSSVGARDQLAGAHVLAEEAGGHPMFIDALVRHRLNHPETGGPLRLDEALVARAVALGDEARRALEYICVAGGPIQQEACAHALGGSFAKFADLVGMLRASNLVKTHGIRRGDLVEPYHDRVREAIAAQLAPGARVEAHARLARSLESSGINDAERLLVHYREGGDARRAARYATRAAERAQAALAFDRAAELYRQALQLDPGPPAQELRLMVHLGEALAYAGRSHEAAKIYLAAAAQAGPEDAVELRRISAAHDLRAGRITEGLETLETVLATIGMTVPKSKGAAIWAFLRERMRFERRGFSFERRDDGQVAPELRRTLDVLVSMYPLGMVDTLRGHRFQTMNLRLSLDAGVPERILRALATEIIFIGTKGPRGTQHLNQLLQLAQQLLGPDPDPFLAGGISTAAGAAATVRGEWKLAHARCDAGERMLRDECAGAIWELDTAQVYSSRALFYLGEIAELRRRLPVQLKEARERGDLWLSTNLRVGYSMVHVCLADDEPAAARRHSEEALRDWSYPGWHVQQLHDLMGMTTVDLYEGDAAAAARRLGAAWPQVKKTLYLRMEYMRHLFGHLRGRVALALARADEAQRKPRLAEAAKIARAMHKEDSSWGQPLAGLLDAGVAHLRGDVAGAIATLATAEEEFTGLDMALFAAVARRQRGRLQGGGDGGALIASADAFMAEQGIRRRERFAELLAPV
jgi:eukaryotic-like serine/threonine-protein kinase